MTSERPSSEAHGSRRRWLGYAVAVVVAGAGAWLVGRAIRPPVRSIVFVVNDATTSAVVDTADGPVTVGADDFARIEVRHRKGEIAKVTTRGSLGLDVPCALEGGVYLVDAGGRGTVGYEDVAFAAEDSPLHAIPTLGPASVAARCTRVSPDVDTRVYGFDETPPQRISVPGPSSPLLVRRHVKLLRHRPPRY